MMRKPAFCICKNKDADQLRVDCATDQRLCFLYLDSTIPPLPFCGCTAQLIMDMIGNPENRFCGDSAH